MNNNNNPVIKSVVYDGEKVRVWWTPSGDTGVKGYVIQIAYLGEKQGEIAYQSDIIQGQQANSGVLDLPGPLNTDMTYLLTIQAIWETGQGQASIAVPMLTGRPVMRIAWYDGTNIHFEWTPNSQAAQGYELIVYSQDSGMTYSNPIPDPNASKGMIPASVITQGFSPDQQWTAVVAALGEKEVSARSPEANFPKPLPTLALDKQKTLYQAGLGINASWTPVAGVTGYCLNVSSPQDDTNLWINISGKDSSIGILPISAPLAENQDYELRLIAPASSGAGVASQLSRIITSLPVLTSVAYDGTGVAMTWEPVFNFLITGYTLMVLSLSSGMMYTADVTGYQGKRGSVPIPQSLDANQAWVARIIARGDNSISGQGYSAPIQVSSPQVNTVRCDGKSVTVDWEALSDNPDEYAVTLFSNAEPVASAFSKGSTVTLAIPEGTTAPNLRVAAQRGGSIGPASPAAAVIDQAPQILTMLTDAITGTVTLTWSEISGATQYVLRFSNRNTESAESAEYIFSTAPSANESLSVTVEAQSTDTTTKINSIGPASPCYDLVTGQPKIIRASYDGVNVSVKWERISNATGYRISVQQPGAAPSEAKSFDAEGFENSAVFPFAPPDKEQTYIAKVQGYFAGPNGASTGPVSQPLPLFQPGFFTSSAANNVAYPNIYPATSMATVYASPPSEDITLFLPHIGGTTPLKELPITQGAFNLEENPDTASNAAYPYRLTIAKDSEAWAFSAEPVRSTLQTDYVAFLKNAEQTAKVVPRGISLLQQAIFRYMPQTFQETLYYAYGLNFPGAGAGSASVDLRPGMVLRVAVDTYQALTGSSSLQWSTGYTGGSVLEYDVGSFIDTSGNWNLGFDNFIGQLVAAGALTVSPPPFHESTQQEAGIADAADLYFPGFRTPFCRLFIPTALATPNEACPTDTPKSFVLAAAPTYDALTTVVNTPDGTNPVAYFRGRAVVRVCIRISLNGNEIVVPVGTTVANLLERLGRLTPPATAQLKELIVKRALGPVVLNPAQPLSPSASYQVRFDWKTQPEYAPGWNALSLPLLPGDSIITES